MTPSDLSAALRPVLQALTTLSVRHFVAGSIASSFHGVPRASIDADIVAELAVHHTPQLLNALADGYYAPARRIADAIERHGSFGVIHLATMVKVDVFIAHGDADQASLSRAGWARLDDGFAVPVCSAEDSLLAKLTWFRRGGETSERQWTDIVGLLRVATMDHHYLDAGAELRGVTDLLDRARGDATSAPALEP